LKKYGDIWIRSRIKSVWISQWRLPFQQCNRTCQRTSHDPESCYEFQRTLHQFLATIISEYYSCSPYWTFPSIYRQKNPRRFIIYLVSHTILPFTSGLLLPFLSFMFIVHLHIHQGILPYLKEGQDIWTVRENNLNHCYWFYIAVIPQLPRYGGY
jgi:hypothetical protein